MLAAHLLWMVSKLACLLTVVLEDVCISSHQVSLALAPTENGSTLLSPNFL